MLKEISHALVVFIIACLVIGLAGAGCTHPTTSSAQPELQSLGLSAVQPHTWAPPTAVFDSRLAASTTILDGFDQLQSRRHVASHEQLLLSIELDQNGKHDLWFVLIEAVASPSTQPMSTFQMGTVTLDNGQMFTIPSRLQATQISVYDANGILLGASPAKVPEAIFSTGPYRVCQYFHELAQQNGDPILDVREHSMTLSIREQKRFARSVGAGLLCLMSFLSTIQDCESLMQLRSSAWNEIARHPSIWSVIKKMGVKLTMEPEFQLAKPALYAWPGEPAPVNAYIFPITMYANDQEAVRCEVITIKPDSPAKLTAGMVAIEARHPAKPEHRLRIQLLAARYSNP